MVVCAVGAYLVVCSLQYRSRCHGRERHKSKLDRHIAVIERRVEQSRSVAEQSRERLAIVRRRRERATNFKLGDKAAKRSSPCAVSRATSGRPHTPVCRPCRDK